MNNQTKGGWKDITNKIKTSIIGEQQTETITTMNIKTIFADMINTKAEGKTKTQYLLNNTTWKPGIRKTYMNKLTRMEASTILNLSNQDVQTMNSTQGCIIKQLCGLDKRSHHTNLLRAINLDNVSTVRSNNTKSVFKRVCSLFVDFFLICEKRFVLYKWHYLVAMETYVTLF